MIKIEKVEVVGFEPAIRGMRNPKNSWDKSDSTFCDRWYDQYNSVCKECIYNNDEYHICNCDYLPRPIIGNNDLTRMKKLAKAGTDHRKFMRMIVVYFDVVAPLYWWKEFDTYKVGTVANSCSTMHKIDDKEFTVDDFSFEHCTNDGIMNSTLEQILWVLNKSRKLYLDTENKKYWWNMIQLLPSSYNQRRTVMLNYEVLANMYHSRKNHKLDEWKKFCKWIETLPYAKELICYE